MKKGKAIAAIGLFFALLAGLFFAPGLYFTAQEALLLGQSRERTARQIQISPEAEELYLVKAIHDIYSSHTQMPSYEEEDILAEWAALQHTTGIEGYSFPHTKALNSNLQYAGTNGETLPEQRLLWPEEAIALGYHREARTGKLISVFLAKSMPDDATNALMEFSFIATRHTNDTLAAAFCSYLGLDVLDDWVPSENGLVSQKAGLQIVCNEEENTITLYVCPLGLEWLHSSWEHTLLADIDTTADEPEG